MTSPYDRDERRDPHAQVEPDDDRPSAADLAADAHDEWDEYLDGPRPTED